VADRAGRKPRFDVSKTDKTRPFWVKMLDKPCYYKAVHRHDARPLRDDKGHVVRVPTGEVRSWGPVMRTVMVPFTECDLPAAPGRDNGEWDACHWTYTRTFMGEGASRCGCSMCNDTEGRKQMTRKERRNGKQVTRNWKDEY